MRRRLCILNVGYPLVPIGPDAVGGAEQILHLLDAALIDRGHHSVVVAPEGSSTRGTLVTIPRLEGALDGSALAAAHAATRRAIDDALGRYPVDLIHLHGLDVDQYLPASGPPALVTLHLPAHAYALSAFELRRPNTYLHCVSQTQHLALPPVALPILEPIPNGVALHAFPVAVDRAQFALALGRICPEKGFHLAARAARAAGIPLLLGGRVFEYESHQRYFEQVLEPLLSDRWLRFLGPLDLERKRRLLAQARCLLIPSQIDETSSLVAMEAAACGTPVIAFRAGALTEVVEHGRTGFLVDSVEEMTSAIQQVDRIDPAECRLVAEERFSADDMATRYLERYQGIVGVQSATPPLQIADVVSVPALETVKADWTDLWQRCGTSVFQHPDWLIPWCQPFQVDDVWVVLFRRGTRLVGVAPLLVYRRHHEQILTLMGAGISDDQDVLVERAERGAVMRALWDYLGRQSERWDRIELENLRAESPLLQPVGPAWVESPAEPDGVRPTILLDPTADGIDSRLARHNFFRDSRYCLRRAARENLSALFEEATPNTFETCFDEVVRLHRLRWTERGETGMLDDRLEDFHRQAARRLLQHGFLRLHVLRLGGQPAAAFYGYHAADTTVFYLGGFDPSFARFSPGKVVVAHAVEHALTRDRARAFDFLRGAESYKYLWGASDQPLYRRRLELARPSTRVRVDLVRAS